LKFAAGGEARADVGAALVPDVVDVAEQLLLVGLGAEDAVHALHVAAVVDDGEAVGGLQLRDELARGHLRLLQLEARHRPRPVDDQGQVHRRARRAGDLDAVEIDGDEQVGGARAHVRVRQAR
jgi:hypothetical protein